MARVALQAQQEIDRVFQRHVDVDIYETFISIQQRKVGEVRPEPNSSRMRVMFDYRFAMADRAAQRAMPHSGPVIPTR